MREIPPHVEVRSLGAVQRAEGHVLGKSLREWRHITAAELGFPDADVVVATGHQAEFWHPGILSKFVWADELARRSNAAVVHLLVDTDTRNPYAVHAPMLQGGILRSIHHSFAGNASRMRPCFQPAQHPTPFPVEAGSHALHSVEQGLARMQQELVANASAPSAAQQVWSALKASLPAEQLFASAPTVTTSQFMATSLGRALLERALNDPAACVLAFNNSLQVASRVARPLPAEPAVYHGYSLPFWIISEPIPGFHIWSNYFKNLAGVDIPPPALGPTALITSAIARIGLCDRFVHGTGAAVYEQATDAFVAQWLGAALPAFDMATATALLPFESTTDALASVPPVPPVPPVTHVERRRAWFDPDGLDGAGLSGRKRRLLAAVNEAPHGSTARRQAWESMQSELEDARRQHATALHDLIAREERDRDHARETSIRTDRTWPAPVYSQNALTQMAELVRQAR